MESYEGIGCRDALGKVRVGLRKKAQESVDHHVAHEVNLRMVDAFAEQILVAVRGRSEEQVRKLIGDEAIDLLGHGAVAGAEPGLDVTNAYAEFCRDQCGGKS